jgi:flavin reductase (DIM6/NTAB) family NADH-FMN oxidoreductase RutF
MTLDSEQLRAAMRAWTTGVAVVAAARDSVKHGMTVNSFTSISLDPPLITISLQRTARTRELIAASGNFGLTILSVDQKELSELFAGRAGNAEDRFANIETETLLTGSPLIKGGLAWLDCRVVQTYDAGMNTLFIAEVVAARGEGSGAPLIYHNRNYWKLSSL